MTVETEVPPKTKEIISVAPNAYNARLVLAQILKDLEYDVEIGHQGKSLEGEDLPEYLRGHMQISFSPKAWDVYQTVCARPNFKVLQDILSVPDSYEQQVAASGLDETKKDNIVVLALSEKSRRIRIEVERLSQQILESGENPLLPKIRGGYESQLNAIERRIKDLSGSGGVLTPDEFTVLVRTEFLEATKANEK